MQQSKFFIAKMDCPSEEQLIKMKLDAFQQIVALQFDIPNRVLTIIHEEDVTPINNALQELKLGSKLLSTTPIDYSTPIEKEQNSERVLLWQVLGINLLFFILEFFTGMIAHSMGLVADSLDMLADSIVYGLALLAVGKTIAQKKSLTKLAGYFQLTLALMGFFEVLRRFVFSESLPISTTMMLIAALALIGNTICLFLLQKNKSSEIHMKASMIFTSNDIIVNIGVITAGAMVALLQSNYPDLIIGIIVFTLVGQGAIKILKLSR